MTATNETVVEPEAPNEPKTKTHIASCTECGSKQLTWHCGQRNKSGVVDGRLRVHDVATEFFLGCDDCSETLRVVNGEEVAGWLTKLQRVGGRV